MGTIGTNSKGYVGGNSNNPSNPSNRNGSDGFKTRLVPCHPFLLPVVTAHHPRRRRSAASNRLRRRPPTPLIPSCTVPVAPPPLQNNTHAKFVRISSLAYTTTAHFYFVYSTDNILLFLSIPSLAPLCIPLKKIRMTDHHISKNTITNTTPSGSPQRPTTRAYASGRSYPRLPAGKHICHRPLPCRSSCPTRRSIARRRTTRHALE